MSKIPAVSRTHVEKAISDIRRNGVPRHRGATGYLLSVGGGTYPPKYVLSLATKYATGRALPSGAFSGGEQTNNIFRNLGYSIIPQDRESHPRAPLIARLVLRGCPSKDAALQRAILIRALTTAWPIGTKAHFLVTPGGFFSLPFPKDWSGNTGWNSTVPDIKPLASLGDAFLRGILRGVAKAAHGKVDVITIGLDMNENGDLKRPHVELVAVFDVSLGKIVRWTGKSYPVPSQEKNLVQFADLETHTVRIAGERVLVLGCHDLNMFSPRGRANQRLGSERRRRCDEMIHLVRRFRPTVVLHHPHQTDSARIWAQGWAGLRGRGRKLRLPEGKEIHSWASGIAYYNSDGRRASLDSVLCATRGDDRRDFDIVLPLQG